MKYLCKEGQSATDYLLVFAAVILVVILILGPKGAVTTSIEESINASVASIKTVAESTCYPDDPTCGTQP